jgi:hypothetical protein
MTLGRSNIHNELFLCSKIRSYFCIRIFGVQPKILTAAHALECSVTLTAYWNVVQANTLQRMLFSHFSENMGSIGSEKMLAA